MLFSGACEKTIKMFMAALAVAGLAACTAGPDLARPDLSRFIPAAFQNSPETDSPDPRALPMAQWWRRLDDPALSMMTADLLSQNLSLEAASARIVQARQRAVITGADFWPQVSGSVSRSRSRTPLDGSTPFSFGGAGPDAVHTTQLNAGVSAAWQVDLFGKIRRSREAAEYGYLASVVDREALAHSLVADLVRQRLAVSTTQRRIELTEDTVQSRARTLETIERRYEHGLAGVNALDVRRARESLNTVKGDLPVLRSQKQDLFYNIDLLLGDSPGTHTITARYSYEALPLPDRLYIPPPVALLDRRPDLKGHELRLAAATADIGVAMADFYPGLSLQGNYAYQSAAFRDWIRPEKIAWSLLSDLTMRLFEGGRLRANLKLQEAEAKELAADYAQAVLEALRDVESALQREENQRRRVARLTDTVKEARAARELAQKRYERGLLPLLDLLDTERRLFATEEQLITAEDAVWQARIDLYLAMGGDWGLSGADGGKVMKTVAKGKPRELIDPYSPPAQKNRRVKNRRDL